MRKKLLVVFLGLLIMFGTTVQAFAEDKSFEIKEAGMTIDLSEEFIVFERVVDEFDKNLELIGSNKKDLEEVFKKGNIYLNGVMIPPDYEIVLTLTEYAGSQEIFDFNSLSKSKLDTLGKQLSSNKDKGETGVTYTGYDTYKQKQAQFIVLDMYQENQAGKVYGKQYYTIINGQAINITLHSYTGEIPQEKLDLVKNAVDSIKFNEVKEKSGEGAMAKVMDVVSMKILLIIGALVIFGTITLIIIGVKRKHKRDYDEEAFDEIHEDEENEVDKNNKNNFTM